MTDENKKENIRTELARSAEILLEADLLYNNGYISGAVSRLYYSLLHNVRGLLLTTGLEPKSHEGVLRLFSLQFVKKGFFEPGVSHIFSKLMKYREEADYNPAYVFTAEDYENLQKEVKVLSDLIREYLLGKDYLTAQNSYNDVMR